MRGGSDFKKPGHISLHQDGPGVFHGVCTQEEQIGLAVRTNLDEETGIQLQLLPLLKVFSVIT